MFRFKPEVLGTTVTSAIFVSFIEFCIIKFGFYLLSFGKDIPMLDITAYVGYKYVGLCFCLIFGFIWPLYGPLLIWAYTGIAYAVFLLRSVKCTLFPESMCGFYNQERKNRIYFLLVVAFLQMIFSYFLIIEPRSLRALRL